MSILAKTKYNNDLVRLRGINLINPFLRRALGQYPFEIETQIFGPKKLTRNLQKEVYKRKEPFIAIIKDNNDDIVDVLMVPFKIEGDSVCVVADGECIPIKSSTKQLVNEIKAIISKNK